MSGSVKFPPTADKWGLIVIRGDEQDRTRVAAFIYNELMVTTMEPHVQAAYQVDSVVRRIMVGAIRHMFEPGLAADNLYALHVDTHPDAAWDTVFAYVRDLFAGTTYQAKMKESLYAAPQYSEGTHGSLYEYFSDLIQRARDARIEGDDLVQLCLRKGEARRVHLQSILDQPQVNYDMGKLLMQLQQRRRPSRSVRCSIATHTGLTHPTTPRNATAARPVASARRRTARRTSVPPSQPAVRPTWPTAPAIGGAAG
jgi:hypothetical protein